MQEQLTTICEYLEQVNKKLDILILAKRNNTGQPLNAQEAAGYLRLSLSRIYCLTQEGQLKPLQRKKFGRILFTTEGLDNYLQCCNKAA